MIEGKNLSYKVRTKTILEGVNVALEVGEITAILGPNGAGKSTLLSCLTGSNKPTEGEVLLDEQLLTSYSLDELAKKRAVLTQSSPINFPFTALEIVMMGRNPYAAASNSEGDAKIVQKVMEEVDAWELRDRVFPTLSGGEQQRVQLARVLAQIWEWNGGVLFLDEPTSALDLKHQHGLLQLVKQLATDKNMVVGVVLHDLHLAMRYADKTVLMKDGSVYQAGMTTDVLQPATIQDVYEIPVEWLTGETPTKQRAA